MHIPITILITNYSVPLRCHIDTTTSISNFLIKTTDWVQVEIQDEMHYF